MKIGEIEKEIERPDGYSQGKYDFALEMEVGDSFLIETTDRFAANNVAMGIRTLCSRKDRASWKLSTRKVEKGWRLWRVK